jgi:uncharacterized protein YraI
MRPIWLVPLLVAAAPLAAAEPKFPYKAFVNTDEVYVRSGPGQSYYPTDKLALGQEVEVYRHDPGGWCAIRPVEGSFCWVNTRYVQLKSDGLAEITSDAVASRIGSRFSDVRDIVGVKLERGELVELIDEREFRRGDNPWCRIAPPAGDFRWVYAKYLDADFPRDGLSKPLASTETEKPVDKPETPVAPSVTAAPLPAGQLAPEDFKRQIEAVDLELAIILAEEPGVWQFDALRKRTEALLERAETAVQRGHARVLLGKLDRFAGIQQRYQSVDLAREETDRARRLLSGVTDATRNMVAAPAAPRFDGTGRLTEIRTANRAAPRFALVDEKGDVQCYVTPAPGINLRHYVGQQVGVSGTRGYMPEQQAQHVMARHISPLEGNVLR